MTLLLLFNAPSAPAPAVARGIPAGPLELNRDHPLARGLVALYLPGLHLHDLTGSCPPLAYGTGTASLTPDGPAHRSAISGSRITNAGAVPAALQLTTAGTLYWRGVRISGPNGSIFWGLGPNPHVDPFIYYGFYGVNGTDVSFDYAAGGVNTVGPVALGVPMGRTSLAATFTVGGAIEIFLGGAFRATTNWTGAAPNYLNLGPGSVNIGGSNGGPTEISNADSALVATWNRALNRDEIALLDRDPYVLVRPALRRAGRRGVLATLRRISPQWLWID